MKILITGANGYLGQGIVKAALDIGCEVVAADFSCEHVDSRAEKMAGSMFDHSDPYEYYGRPDALLHLAWRDGFVHNSPNHLGDLNSHYEFIKKMIESGCKDISVMGTMHEIGFFEGSIDENTPCRPMNLYGIAKNALRQATEALCAANGATFKWLRGYYIVGNSTFGNSIFSKITAAEKEGKTEFPFTTGQNQYDFCDYDEFCMQVALAAAQNEVCGIINIGSGRPEKLCDRVERFIKENGYSIKLKYGAFPDRKYDSFAVWGNGSRIEKIKENSKR